MLSLHRHKVTQLDMHSDMTRHHAGKAVLL